MFDPIDDNFEFENTFNKGEKQHWENSFLVSKYIKEMDNLENQFVPVCSLEDTDKIYKELKNISSEQLEYGFSSSNINKMNIEYMCR